MTLDYLEDFIRLTKEKIYEIVVNQVEKQSNAFMEGFKKVINPVYLQKFTSEELRELAEGSDKISGIFLVI